MEVNRGFWKRRENGTVDQIELPRRKWLQSETDKSIKAKILYRWNPPYQLLEALPNWYDLCLVCEVHKDGTRRFVPVCRELAADSRYFGSGPTPVAGSLAMIASLGGYAILADRGQLHRKSPLTHHESRIFLQYVRNMREHYGRTTRLGRALLICAGGRIDRESKDILPDDLGVVPQGNRNRWDLKRLRAEGLVGALAAGCETPTSEDILRQGLLAGARIAPAAESEDTIVNLVRLALFDVGPDAEWESDAKTADRKLKKETSQRLRDEAVSYVARHVKKSLAEHQTETTDQFDSWIDDPKSNLIHRISKRKDCKFSRKQVRWALLELGWQAFKTLGQCMDAQMRAFREAFSDPLNDSENTLFEHTYLAQPTFGGLPLLLMQERFDFLREAILATWNDPADETAIAVVHTMLRYFGAMASSRRAADRRYKQRAAHRTSEGRVSRDEVYSEQVQGRDTDAQAAANTFAEIAAEHRRHRHAACKCESTDNWEAKLVLGSSKDEYIINDGCAVCGENESVEVSRAELTAIAMRVFADDD